LNITSAAVVPCLPTILLVDDDFVCRSKLCEQLTQMDYKVIVAKDGESAWGILAIPERARAITLIITDIRMPLMDGLELIEKTRARMPEMPIVVLTAYDDNEIVKKALRLGAKDFFEKPVKDTTGFSNRITAVIKEASWDVRRRLKEVKNHSNSSLEQLTNREKEVLKLTVDGYTSGESSSLLCISRRTVEGYRSSILQKLGLRTSYDLYRFALRAGIV